MHLNSMEYKFEEAMCVSFAKIRRIVSTILAKVWITIRIHYINAEYLKITEMILPFAPNGVSESTKRLFKMTTLRFGAKN